MKGWLDNFGKADNANESNVSLPEDFNGLAYDTTGRNYSPAWGGQFQNGGKLSYDDWKKFYGLQESPNYNLKRAHELGYEPVDGHLPSIDSETGDFLKLKGHPTLFKEIQYWQTNPELNKALFPSMKPDGNLQYNPRRMQTGGTLPGSAGFMYARTIDPAPSNGKYAKKTKASAQNGKEMQFYQEGLDWKPKSMRDGGITKDNQGYWNPDNWGKPVEIGSNDITMRGVYEPLLGISDTGDVQYMTPGNDYKFKGSKVTEFPVAQKGMDVPDATVANMIRGLIPLPTNVSQLISNEFFGDARMNNSSLSDNQKLILWNTIQNARERTGKDQGGTMYQDYGNQGWGSPEQFHDWFNKGKSSTMDMVVNSFSNPAYSLATTIGRGTYSVDKDDPNTIYYSDSYDFNKGEKNFKGENQYQKLRNYLREHGEEHIDNGKSAMKFTLTKSEIDEIKKKQDWMNSGPQFGRYAGMPVFDKKKNGGTVGINDLDAQPMKKLNQLLNFTNNPDKTNWLDKYQ